jgi:AmpD protein
MNIDPATHLLENAIYLPSPNMDDRPAGTAIDLIVVHCISLPPGEFGGDWIERFFGNELPADAHPYFAEIQPLKVSAHALIKRDGTVVQFVPFHKRAWHAGVSCYRGRECCNDYSIGIELEGTDDSEFETAQYKSLAELIRALRDHYPLIGADNITGHSDIAPGRKTDPGAGFDWERLKTLLV